MDTFRFKYAADNIGSNGTSIDKYIYPQTEDRAFHEAAKYLTSIKAVYLPGSMEVFTASGWKTVVDPPMALACSNTVAPPIQPVLHVEDEMATSKRHA
jgi:hypothetical protein